MFSSLSLVEDLLTHLNEDTDVVSELGKDAVFHAAVDKDQPTPFLLFSFRNSLRNAQGYGIAQSSGQVVEATVTLAIINEAHDPTGLGALSDTADSALRTWSPNGWGVRQIEAIEERTESFTEEGQTLQSASMVYFIILERN